MFHRFNKPRLLLSAVVLLALWLIVGCSSTATDEPASTDTPPAARRRDGADCGRHRSFRRSTFRRPVARSNPSTHCCYADRWKPRWIAW